jgi:CRISPR system Cascade subunit CasD
LEDPRWPVYLGRKSCPPARPVLEGVGDHETPEAALAAWPAHLAQPEGATTRMRAVVECPVGEGSRRRDELISNARRVFGVRFTRDVDLEVPVEKEEACTSPD